MSQQQKQPAIQQSTSSLVSPHKIGLMLVVTGLTSGAVIYVRYSGMFGGSSYDGIVPGLISLSLISLGSSLMARRKYLSLWHLVAIVLPLLAIALCLFLVAVFLTLGCMTGPCK